MKEGVLKKRLVCLILICRVLIFIFLIFLNFMGGIAKDELWQLIFLMTPITVLYAAVVLKFISVNRYLARGESLPSGYSVFSWLFLAFIYFSELLLIVLNAAFMTITAGNLHTGILICECLLAAYAGLNLTALFAKDR